MPVMNSAPPGPEVTGMKMNEPSPNAPLLTPQPEVKLTLFCHSLLNHSPVFAVVFNSLQIVSETVQSFSNSLFAALIVTIF